MVGASIQALLYLFENRIFYKTRAKGVIRVKCRRGGKFVGSRGIVVVIGGLWFDETIIITSLDKRKSKEYDRLNVNITSISGGKQHDMAATIMLTNQEAP